MSPSRRQLLKALGLGAVSRAAFAGHARAPSRVVFFIQPHGHIPKAWNVPCPGTQLRLADAKWPEVLRPLQPFAEQLLVVEGLAHTTMLYDIAQVMKEGGDLNNHQVAVADLLTGARAAQIPGARCTGGARSLDQELGARLSAPGRFDTRVYGADYVPNQTVSPFSFVGSKQAAPVVHDPATAFADLLGLTDVTAGRRASVLDAVAHEYAALAPSLDAEGRRRLEQHQQLVSDLEQSLTARAPKCTLAFDGSLPDRIAQFMRIVRLALACDLTRVVTYVAPVPSCPELGYPADAEFHGTYAHASIEGATSCGTTYTPLAERAMIDLGAWYARHFAQLLNELQSVPEGDSTLLDHTAVVWLTELGTPTHRHDDVFTVIAGGCNRAFRTGRYVRYPRTLPNPMAGGPLIGPAQSRLFVNVLRALGQSDDAFGLSEVAAADGTAVSLRGALSEL